MVVVDPEPAIPSVVGVPMDEVVEPGGSAEVDTVVPDWAVSVAVGPRLSLQPCESDQRSARLQPETAGAIPASTSHRPVAKRKVLRSICRMAAV